MAATAYVDRVTTLSAVEDRSAIVEMVREARVVDLTDSDFAVLFSALEAAGVPAAESSPAGYPNLILVKRSPRLVPGETHKVDVRLEYLAKGRAGLNFVFEGGTGLKQIQTEKNYYGQALYTSYTYPADYQYDTTLQNETIAQGGSVSVLLPETTVRATGILERDYPHYVSAEWTGRLNSARWAGGPVGVWLCTDVSYRLHDFNSTPKKWEYTFTFQADLSGWQPRIVFIDPNTGKPPSNLVSGVGIKDVVWYPYKDFNELFPTTE